MLIDQWEHYRHALIAKEATDVYTAACPGSITRAASIKTSGLFRLARRTVSLFSVEIKSCGSWSSVLIVDGRGTEIFYQPSLFTGSFKLEDPVCYDGLLVYALSGPGSDALIDINWRQPND